MWMSFYTNFDKQGQSAIRTGPEVGKRSIKKQSYWTFFDKSSAKNAYVLLQIKLWKRTNEKIIIGQL